MHATGELVSEGGKLAVKGANKALFSKYAQVGKNFLTNSLREGVIEEGMQTAMSGYYKKKAEEKAKLEREGKQVEEGSFTEELAKDVSGITTEWAKGWSNREGQESMFLGAMIGGVTGIPSGINTAAQNKETAKIAGDRYRSVKESSLKDMDRVGEIYQEMDNVSGDSKLSEGERSLKLESLKNDLFKVEVANSLIHDETINGTIVGDNADQLIDSYKQIQNMDNETPLSESVYQPKVDTLTEELNIANTIIEREKEETGQEPSEEALQEVEAIKKKLNNTIKEQRKYSDVTEAQSKGFSKGKGDNTYVDHAKQAVKDIEEIVTAHETIVNKYNSPIDFKLGTANELLKFKTSEIVSKNTVENLENKLATTTQEHEDSLGKKATVSSVTSYSFNKALYSLLYKSAFLLTTAASFNL